MDEGRNKWWVAASSWQLLQSGQVLLILTGCAFLVVDTRLRKARSVSASFLNVPWPEGKSDLRVATAMISYVLSRQEPLVDRSFLVVKR